MYTTGQKFGQPDIFYITKVKGDSKNPLIPLNPNPYPMCEEQKLGHPVKYVSE